MIYNVSFICRGEKMNEKEEKIIIDLFLAAYKDYKKNHEQYYYIETCTIKRVAMKLGIPESKLYESVKR